MLSKDQRKPGSCSLPLIAGSVALPETRRGRKAAGWVQTGQRES